jgi:hypothetical protein
LLIPTKTVSVTITKAKEQEPREKTSLIKTAMANATIVVQTVRAKEQAIVVPKDKVAEKARVKETAAGRAISTVMVVQARAVSQLPNPTSK